MTTRHYIMMVVPAAVVVTMVVVFRSLTSHLGYPLGYLSAFVVYWVGWCSALPLAVLGVHGLAGLFRQAQPSESRFDAGTVGLLTWPLVFPMVFAFLPRVTMAGPAIVGLSVCLGIATGVAEEVLWRGVYLRVFPHSLWWNTVYPSLAFGVWHVAPLSVLPSRYPGGAIGFVVYSTLLGLSYATAARRTQSIRWVTLSHCIHDALGLGGFAYAAWIR